MDRSAPKGPLCKFINDCRDFKRTGQCKFRHDACTYKEKCRLGDECKYYHPERAGRVNTESRPPRDGASKTPAKDTPCKFGANCNKKALGTCPFNHDLPPAPRQSSSVSVPNQKSQIPQQCKFGDDCRNFKNGTCKYKHSNAPANNSQKNQPQDQSKKPLTRQMSMEQNPRTNHNNNNNKTTNNNQPQVQIHLNYNQQYQKYETEKLCKAYATGQCQSGSECNQSHSFTLDNTLKRTFLTTFNPNTSTHCISFKISNTRVFALAQNNTIGFYELDATLGVLKSVSASEIRVDAVITGMWAIGDEGQGQGQGNNLDSVLLVFVTENGILYRYSPGRGVIDSEEYQNPRAIVGATYFTQENLIFVANSMTGFLVYKNGQKQQPTLTKITSKGPILAKPKLLKHFSLLGQNFLTIVSQTSPSTLTILNKNLQIKSHQLPQSTTILDLHATLINEKPLLLVAVCENGRKYSVLAMSLLDFSMQTFIELNDMPVSKVYISYGRIFVGVDGAGVLVYPVNQLPRIRGRIPLGGRIRSIECDGDGNLVVLEELPQSHGVSLSIYILRK